MDPITIVNEALAAFQAVLAIIGAIRGSGGLTDDQILAAAETQCGKNSATYAALVAHLGLYV